MKCSQAPRHSWWRAGLDVINGELRWLRRCTFCGATKTLPYRWRSR